MIRTPDQRLRVFVSSTLQELAPERVAARTAIEQLRLVPVMFELGARPHPPQEVYRAYLEQSHVFVGLYWRRYGWVAPDMDISGLEDEWRLSHGHPRLVYLKSAGDEGREPRLDQLIDDIRSAGVSYREFAHSAELRELLENDLAVLLTERFESSDTLVVDLRPRPAPAPGRLPASPTPIIGRNDELAELERLLLDGATRMVSITGTGGCGKTRLAMELATVMRDEHGWNAAFADLSSLRNAELVPATIAAAFGVRDVADDEVIDAIASVMAGRSMLLVVDNFEHVLTAATMVAELLAAAEGVTVVVTSRRPLHLRWEQEFPLTPLAVPDPEQQSTAESIGAAPAVELLVDCIRRARPSFRLDDDVAPILAEIARRLDGLPLALELAAARLRVVRPAELLSRLNRSLDALADSAPDLPARHRTLRATITTSHDQLSDVERAVFRRFGVFAGGAGLEAIEAVCAADDVDGDVLEALGALVDCSLVCLTEEPGPEIHTGSSRYTMLSTIREFAVEQLVAAGEADATWDRHLAWHAELCERAWAGFWSADMEAWLATVEAERDNVRTAMDHGVGSGDPLVGLRLASFLWPFWDVNGQYREGERRLADLLERVGPVGCVERGRGLMAQGWVVALMGDFERARGLMEVGVGLVRDHGDRYQLAWSLAEIGNVTFSLGDAEASCAHFTESLALAEELSDSFLIGLGHFGLAYVAFLNGDLATMRTELGRSLAMTRDMYQPWGIAWAQFSMGVLTIIEGDTAGAVEPLTESLQLRWSMRDARGLAETLQLLATLASANGDPEWSAMLHGAAELQREANGLTILPFLRPLHDESVGRLHATLGEAETARIWALGRNAPLEKLVQEALGRGVPAPS